MALYVADEMFVCVMNTVGKSHLLDKMQLCSCVFYLLTYVLTDTQKAEQGVHHEAFGHTVCAWSHGAP